MTTVLVVNSYVAVARGHGGTFGALARHPPREKIFLLKVALSLRILWDRN